MGETTAINWCDCTKSPWTVCTPVSPACAHCYARGEAKRRGWSQEWGAGVPRHRFTGFRDAVLAMERKAAGGWFRQCPLCGWRGFIRPRGKGLGACACGEISYELAVAGGWSIARPRVFPSLCDWIDPEVPAEWLADFLDVIRLTPHLDWMLLTKRPGVWRERLIAAMQHNENNRGTAEAHAWMLDWADGAKFPANVYIGLTAENQAAADERMADLFRIPAAKYFVSCEPCLGLTVFNPEDLRRLSLLICGGESGPHARPTHPDWVRSLRDQCAAAGVEFNFKQWGEWAPQSVVSDCDLNKPRHQFPGRESGSYGTLTPVYRVGKKRAGRVLDGRTWDGSI